MHIVKFLVFILVLYKAFFHHLKLRNFIFKKKIIFCSWWCQKRFMLQNVPIKMGLQGRLQNCLWFLIVNKWQNCLYLWNWWTQFLISPSMLNLWKMLTTFWKSTFSILLFQEGCYLVCLLFIEGDNAYWSTFFFYLKLCKVRSLLK